MRSPWVDLLFLHGHAGPGTLKWLPDEPACPCQAEQVNVDIAALPLPACTEKHDPCDPCSA